MGSNRKDHCACGKEKFAGTKQCVACFRARVGYTKVQHTCKRCGGQVHRQTKHGLCKNCMNPEHQGSSFRSNGNTAELTEITDTRITSPEQLIEFCKVDTAVWEIERFVCNKWEMGAKVGSKGNPTVKVTQLFQIKAWLKRKTVVIDARREIEALIEDAKSRVSRFIAPVLENYDPASPYMLELHIPDLHVGKLAWSKETGYDNYDSRIALQLYSDAIDHLIAQTANFKFGLIILVVGNDMFHSDTKQGTTTKGTPLDVDSRYHKTFLSVRRLLTQKIEELSSVAPVKVIVVPGNHDTLAAFHLGDSLECRFHNAVGVTVDNAPKMRKYHRHGQVLLMWTHGNAGKLEKYPLLMAQEERVAWGQTKFKEAHTGDKHTTKVQEFQGVRVRISPALCSADAWHSENHFVGSQRGAEAYVWHADKGLVSLSFFNVESGEHATCAK